MNVLICFTFLPFWFWFGQEFYSFFIFSYGIQVFPNNFSKVTFSGIFFCASYTRLISSFLSLLYMWFILLDNLDCTNSTTCKMHMKQKNWLPVLFQMLSFKSNIKSRCKTISLLPAMLRYGYRWAPWNQQLDWTAFYTLFKYENFHLYASACAILNFKLCWITLQAWGFSPQCICKCFFKLPACLNDFLHCLQL